MTSERTSWTVLDRDITEVAPIPGQERTFLSLVFDDGAGLMRSFGVGATPSRARVRALGCAVTSPRPPLRADLPDRLVCAPGCGTDVRADAAAALERGMPLPAVDERVLPRGVEAFLDEMMAHFASEDDKPADNEWRLLVSCTLDFERTAPWREWPTDLQLRAEVAVDGTPASYVAAVTGGDGMRAGLVLYPGRGYSDVIIPADDWAPTDPLPFRDGSLVMHLNPADDTIEELATAAVVFGWPADSASMPVWLAAGPDGFADIDRAQAVQLGLAITGVLAWHRQTPESGRVAGTVALPGGGTGRFALTDLRDQP